MPAYLGTLGLLVPFKSPKVARVDPSRVESVETTLEGRRTVTVGGADRRVWELSVDLAHPRDVASIEALGAGEFGRGPFVWVSTDARATNMLTPEVSTCAPEAAVQATATVAGPLKVAGEGFAGRSLSNSNTAVSLSFGSTPVPVLPGEKVTASAGLLGLDAQMGVTFYTAAGVYISAATSTTRGVASEARRLAVTATAPTTAAYCLVYGVKAVAGARPSLTWTSDPQPWVVGHGCPKAYVSPVTGLSTPSGLRTISCTITEVG